MSAVSSSASARFSPLPLSSELEDNTPITISSESCFPGCGDEVLIARVQIGDDDALGLLFRRFSSIVNNIGWRILRDKTEADDLVQEVFLYIHRKSSLFDSSKGSARSWIVQVSYTQALLRRRRLKSQGFYASVIADKS